MSTPIQNPAEYRKAVGKLLGDAPPTEGRPAQEQNRGAARRLGRKTRPELLRGSKSDLGRPHRCWRSSIASANWVRLIPNPTLKA